MAAAVAAELERLQGALAGGNLTEIITKYPIRETQALSEIAIKLGFQAKKQYEGAVRKLLMDDKEALSFVRSLFGTLETDITAAS